MNAIKLSFNYMATGIACITIPLSVAFAAPLYSPTPQATQIPQTTPAYTTGSTIYSIPGFVVGTQEMPSGTPDLAAAPAVQSGPRKCSDLCLSKHNPTGWWLGNFFTDWFNATWVPAAEYNACLDACNAARQPNGCEDRDNDGSPEIDTLCDNKGNPKLVQACRDGCNAACGAGTCGDGGGNGLL